MKKPYMTDQDFVQFGDQFSRQYDFYHNYDKPKISDEESVKDILRAKSVTFVVTESCNLSCTYCYERHKTEKRMTRETAFKAVDALFSKEKMANYVNHDVSTAIVLEFIGGEPLLEIDLINETTDYLIAKAYENDHSWANNYMISISTNGILYNDERVQKFIRKHINRVSIGISVDGNKDLHDSCRVFPDGSGSYDIVEKSVAGWMKFNPTFTTKLTLAPENVHYFKDSVLHLKNNLGITGIYANCVYEEGWTSDSAIILYHQMKELADEILDNDLYDKIFCSMYNENLGSPKESIDNKNWCGGDGQMLAISVDGGFYPCLRYIPFTISTPGREDIFKLGDIENGIVPYKDSEARKCLNCITRRSQSTDECFNCPIAEGCAWCTAYHYDEFGDPNVRATYICITHKARVLANVYYWNKLYKKLGLDDKFEYHMPDEWALEIIDMAEINMLKDLAK